jgi:hypothetical protein
LILAEVLKGNKNMSVRHSSCDAGRISRRQAIRRGLGGAAAALVA